MENASKALLMAAGILIGLILMAVLVYFANNLGVFPTEVDKVQKTEQIQAFNTEYEAYNKRIMYGTDLISVLNKAKSNNEKYVKGHFLIGQEYPEEYVINIKFKFKSKLEDKITVSYLNAQKEIDEHSNTLRYTSVSEVNYTDNHGVEHSPDTITLLSVFGEPSNDYIEKVSGAINNTTPLKTRTYESTKFNNTTNYYSLCAVEGKPDINDDVNSLLNCSSAITRVVKNKTKNIEEKLLQYKKNGITYDGWSSAEWKTCLYDLKTRKFECKSTKYNETTGRIIEMVFDEI